MKEREWNGRCQRCRVKSYSYIMSMYSVTLICSLCSDKERERPDYDEAAKTESNEVKKGNFNYEGVGER